MKDDSDSLSKSESEEEMEFSDDQGSVFRVKNKDQPNTSVASRFVKERLIVPPTINPNGRVTRATAKYLENQ